MTLYYSTFITGTQEIVKKVLKEKLKDVKIDLLLDGLVVYKTDKPLNQIKSLRFINNSYFLLKMFKEKGDCEPQELIKSAISGPEIISNVPKSALKGVKSFRVIASRENQLISVDKQILQKVEGLLEKKLKLEVNRTLPDVEVWFLTRKEGYGFIGLRMTKTPNYEKTLQKGELRPELANIMCILAEFKPSDVVLDPFAGYGAIPLECGRSFRVGQIFAGEKDKEVFKVLQEKTRDSKPKMVVGRWDALNLSSLTNNSVDKIVTDPPWGFYGSQEQDLKTFYKDMLGEFIRVVKPKGTIVIVTAQKEMFEDLIKEFSSLNLEDKYDVLVSGKKAAIYKIKRL